MKTETQVTPGPWHVEIHDKRVEYDSGGPGREITFQTFPVSLIMHEPKDEPRLRTCIAEMSTSTETEANARLIAAAPDLLEACRQVLIASEDNGGMDDIDWNGLRAAVAKAEGTP